MRSSPDLKSGHAVFLAGEFPIAFDGSVVSGQELGASLHMGHLHVAADVNVECPSASVPLQNEAAVVVETSGCPVIVDDNVVSAKRGTR